MASDKVENLVFFGMGLFRFRKLSIQKEGFFPDHRHDAVEILIPDGIKGQALTPTERAPFKDGYALVVPANLVHATWTLPARPQSGLRFIQINAPRLSSMAGGFSPEALEEGGMAWLLRGNTLLDINLDLIRPEVDALFTHPTQGAAGALFTTFALVNRLLEAVGKGPAQGGGVNPSLRNPQTEEIIAFLERHYGEPLDLAALASRFGCTPHHLCRQFKRRTGKTLGDYLRYTRISRAMNMIMKGAERMGEVGHAVGFRDLNHFARCFREVTGETPKRFQKRAAGGPANQAPIFNIPNQTGP